MPSTKSSPLRTFTINNAYHVDGCPTKFSHKDYTGRFTSRSAARAAMKALTELCHAKRIRGACSIYIEMRETTQGSKHKLYGYKAKRVKKKEPVVIAGKFSREYDSVVKAVRIPTEKCPKSHKSSGRMKSFKRSSKAVMRDMKRQSSKRSSKRSSKSSSKRSSKNTKKSSKTKKSFVKSMMNKIF